MKFWVDDFSNQYFSNTQEHKKRKYLFGIFVLRLDYYDVKIGEAIIKGFVPDEIFNELDASLKRAGLELMNDKNSVLVERITIAIIEWVHYSK